MKINIEIIDETRFRNLDSGVVFMYGDSVFMKIKEIAFSGSVRNAVNMHDGDNYYFSEDIVVIRCEAVLNVGVFKEDAE